MNYADGPQVITRVLIRGKKAGGPSQRRKYDKGSREQRVMGGVIFNWVVTKVSLER